MAMDSNERKMNSKQVLIGRGSFPFTSAKIIIATSLHKNANISS